MRHIGPGETPGDRASDSATPARPDDVVRYVVDLMITEDRGLIPIVDADSRVLRGIITRKDLLAVRQGRRRAGARPQPPGRATEALVARRL